MKKKHKKNKQTNKQTKNKTNITLSEIYKNCNFSVKKQVY